MTDHFRTIINSNYVSRLDGKFQILLHNGDSDLVCDFMQAEYFVEDLVTVVGGTPAPEGRRPWRAFLPGGLTGEAAPVAGFQKRFSFNSNKVQLDLVTVKGSGHFVPVDTPLVGLQLFSSFVQKKTSIEEPINVALSRQPLKGQYAPLGTHPPDLDPDTTSTANTGTTNPGGSTESTVSGGTATPSTTTPDSANRTAPSLVASFLLAFYVFRFF